VREGDVVVVSRLDRLARSTLDLLGIAEQLRDGISSASIKNSAYRILGKLLP
jgi:DNA invertase Pin-like site-specific DNA recombinase